MCHRGCGRAPGQLFDLQIGAGLVGLGYPMGHAALVQHLLKVQLAKAETLTDWSRRPLTDQQLQYAYDDVRSMWPQVSWEDVLARDPDLLVLGDLTRDGEGDSLAAKQHFLRTDPAVSRLPAAAESRWMGMTGTEMNVSMRTITGIERLADRLAELERR